MPRRLSEHEAWLLLHETIVATKGQAMINRSGNKLIGLCAAVITLQIHDNAISPSTETKMLNRIWRTVKRDMGLNRVYFTRPMCWTNGVRARYALRFAEETAPQ
jgi:hypothetical protein